MQGAEEYLSAHGVAAALNAAVRRAVRERPSNPVAAIGDYLLEQPQPTQSTPLAPAPAALSGGEKDAAATISGYMRCMSSKLRTSGRGAQNAELLLAQRADGVLSIDDLGGWAQRNESMARMLRELDARGVLSDFPLLAIQTGDRCIVRHAPDGAVELHLWQNQPLSADVRQRLPLRRVLSMCGSPKYADVPVPDWCFDAWPEAGVAEGGFDDYCARLAAAGASTPAAPHALAWFGTAHHHPSRMRLMDLAAEQPQRLRCVNVVDKSASTDAAFSSLEAQVRACGYLLDVQGKGYSSRLKLLLHTGRPVFLVARPWQEYYMHALTPYTHYVPVRENLSDLLAQLDWADAHPTEVAAIAQRAQEYARAHLTRAAALAALARAISEGSALAIDGEGKGEEGTDGAVAAKAADGTGGGLGGDAAELRRGDWASNRGAYDAVRMYYRWTYMPVSKDRRRPLALLASRGVADLSAQDVYTFGVYTGASMKFWFDGFESLGLTTGTHCASARCEAAWRAREAGLTRARGRAYARVPPPQQLGLPRPAPRSRSRSLPAPTPMPMRAIHAPPYMRRARRGLRLIRGASRGEGGYGARVQRVAARLLLRRRPVWRLHVR